MKVLVVGYPKTGTKSVASALTTLGYDVLDFDATFDQLGKDWEKIFTTGGAKEDFYRMYKNVDATCDAPACAFWEDILEAFPNMKLILMQRNSPEEWFPSMQHQRKMLNANYTIKVYAWFSPTARAFFRYINHLDRTTLGACMSRKFYSLEDYVSPTLLKMRYRNHNAAVMMRAPKDQLLIFNLSDGWEPLCKFLGKPVPKLPFPHKNKGGKLYEEYVESSPVFGKMKKEAVIYSCIYIAALASSVFCVYNYAFKST